MDAQLVIFFFFFFLLFTHLHPRLGPILCFKKRRWMGGRCALQFIFFKCLLKANLQSHSNFTPFPQSLVNQLLINTEANQQRTLLCFFLLSPVFLRITTCKGKHKTELVRLEVKQAQPAPFRLFPLGWERAEGLYELVHFFLAVPVSPSSFGKESYSLPPKALKKYLEISSDKGRECGICSCTVVLLHQFYFGAREGIDTELRMRKKGFGAAIPTRINPWNPFQELGQGARAQGACVTLPYISHGKELQTEGGNTEESVQGLGTVPPQLRSPEALKCCGLSELRVV